MTEADTYDEGWSECQAGTLVRFSKQERNRTIKNRVAKSIGYLAVLVICCFAFTQFVSPPSTGISDPTYGGIRCSEVKQNASNYLANTLDDTLRAKMDAHILECPNCRALFKGVQAQNKVTTNVNPFSLAYRSDSAGLLSW